MAPAYMQAGSSCAKDRCSTHSTFRERVSGLGISCNSTAQAPSESMKRKKSFSNAMIPSPSSWATFAPSSLKYFASIQIENLSEPVQTALDAVPDRIDKYPNFRAWIPALHAPVVELISTGYPPNAP